MSDADGPRADLARDVALLRKFVATVSDLDGIEDDADLPDHVHNAAEKLDDTTDEVLERLDELEGRVAMLEAHSNGGERVDKYRTLVEVAGNRRSRTSGDGAALHYDDVMDATGCSKPTAYDVMRSMADEFEFATFSNPEDRKRRLEIAFNGDDAADLLARINGK